MTHGAPLRHYPSFAALLAEVAARGFRSSRRGGRERAAAVAPGAGADCATRRRCARLLDCAIARPGVLRADVPARARRRHARRPSCATRTTPSSSWCAWSAARRTAAGIPRATRGSSPGSLWASIHGLASLWSHGALRDRGPRSVTRAAARDACSTLLIGATARPHREETTMSENPYLSGNFAPVTEEVTAFDLPRHRHDPARAERSPAAHRPEPGRPPDPAKYHWFIGNGMVHGLRLRDGRAEWYRNRFVRDDEVAAREGLAADAGAAPRHGQRRRQHQRDRPRRPHLRDRRGRRPAGRAQRRARDGRAARTSTARCRAASPRIRSATPTPASCTPSSTTGSGTTCSTSWSAPTAGCASTVDVPVPGKPMMHDCAITENYVVLFDLPCVFDARRRDGGRASPTSGSPDYGARVGLLPREGDAAQVRWLEVAPATSSTR